jgi:hypothetical protein
MDASFARDATIRLRRFVGLAAIGAGAQVGCGSATGAVLTRLRVVVGVLGPVDPALCVQLVEVDSEQAILVANLK